MNKKFHTGKKHVGQVIKVFVRTENELGKPLKFSNELKIRWASREISALKTKTSFRHSLSH